MMKKVDNLIEVDSKLDLDYDLQFIIQFCTYQSFISLGLAYFPFWKSQAW